MSNWEKHLKAWTQLPAVKREAEQATVELERQAQQKRLAEAELLAVEKLVMMADDELANHRANQPDEFLNPIEKPNWYKKLYRLQEQRSTLMKNRTEVMARIAQSRIAMVRLIKGIENLRRCERNLEAVVEGRNPASGWEGGVYRVM
jgi:hypothetical protein